MKKTFFRTNKFKIIATIVVIVFALIVVGGIIKFCHYKSSFVKMDETQVNSAKDVALAALEAQGKNISNYEVKVVPQFRRMHEKNNSLNLVEVFFFNSKEMQLFLINMDTKEILMRTETDYYKTNELMPGPKMGCGERKDKEELENSTAPNRPCSPPPEEGRWFHGNFVK